jgi:hypothetical protein
MITKEPPVKFFEEDDYYLMSNIFPRSSGLPFCVWISDRGHAQHDVRVKVTKGPKVIAGEMAASVALRPTIRIVEGDMPAKDFKLLVQWLELNRQTIIDHWNGEIDSIEAGNRLVRIEK